MNKDEIKFYENKGIRSLWDEEKEEWYFSVVDIVGVLTESVNPGDYWYRVKKRMSEEEKSQLSTTCRQLKLQSSDGKKYKTDVADLKFFLELFNLFCRQKLSRFLVSLSYLEIFATFKPR